MPGIIRRIARSPGAPIAALGALLCLSIIALFLIDLQTRYWDRIAAAKTDAQVRATRDAHATGNIFFSMRSLMPGNMVLPPESMTLPYN